MNAKQATVSISRFAMENYADVYALWQKCQGVGLSSADSPEQIAAYLDRNPGMSFVAKDEETVVGAILCGHDGRRGYIHHLAVLESHRRFGIGRHLVSNSLAALKAEGIQKCHLFIFHQNESGIAFWQSIGWTYRQDIGVLSTHINQGKK